MRVHLSFCVWMFALLALAPLERASAQNPATPVSAPQRDYSWISAPWTEDSGPYIEASKEVFEKLSKNSGRSNELIEAMERVINERSSALNRLRLACAYLWAEQNRQGGKQTATQIDKLRYCSKILDVHPAPNAWYYARVRFLTQCIAGVAPLKFLTLAKRLLGKDPHDDEVKKEYILLLSWGDRQEQNTAVELSEARLKQQPNDPNNHRLVGYSYWGLYATSKNVGHLNKALSYYQEYLRRANANDPNYADALEIQATLKRLQKNPLK